MRCYQKNIQKSNNLQIWNEEISPTRRYVIIRVSSDDIIERVKVITGDTLAKFDTTGTLTQKYQARLIPREATADLVTPEDTDNLKSVLINKNHRTLFDTLPINYPSSQNLLPIAVIFKRLRGLVNSQFADVGSDQERNRGVGAELTDENAPHLPEVRRPSDPPHPRRGPGTTRRPGDRPAQRAVRGLRL